ncbi:membrane protein [Microbacterium resistens]|uniref:Membrane protein n=1 Tax=Microbacterium resistens TaxID=156977 RepID=A0ABU1S9I1_9MICO|nr:YihY/virulence factor BrkB family protein [Microbacterium resistens]MDR6866255.1 membrane protein [Microbacterium resistens]
MTTRADDPDVSDAPSADADADARALHALPAPLTQWEAPLGRAVQITRRTLAWFPIRVWRHFLQHNGFLLAAGVSYQALFSMFALIYVSFAGAGLWLGGSPDAVQRLIGMINDYIPGLIADDGGLFTTAQVTQITEQSVGVLAATGIAALLAAIWTSIGFITFARRAVRDVLGVPPDRRNYLLLKARDLVAAVVFAVLLVVGSALVSTGTWAIGIVFDLFSWDTASAWYTLSAQLGSIAISFAVFSIAIGVLLRFLVGISIPLRGILPGAMIGGGALTVLQIGAGLLLSHTPSNPLLATFAIFVGLLLWFRLVGVVLLVASSWVAVAAVDDDVPLTPEELRAQEHRIRVETAQERLRAAVSARRNAPWWRRRGVQHEVQEAWDELTALTSGDSAGMGPAPRDVR